VVTVREKKLHMAVVQGGKRRIWQLDRKEYDDILYM
jgi:hypothetical protein